MSVFWSIWRGPKATLRSPWPDYVAMRLLAFQSLDHHFRSLVRSALEESGFYLSAEHFYDTLKGLI